MIRKILLLALALFAPSVWAYTTTTCRNGETGTCYLTNGSQSDVQAAVNAAAAGGNGTLDAGGNPRNGTFDGAGIYLPAGNFTWSSRVSWNNKNILIQGAGKGTCNPTTSAHNCTCNGATSTCITASSSGTANFMNPTASASNKMQWRISNMYVTNSGNNGAIMVNSNVNYGVIPSTAAYGFRIDNMTLNYPGANVEGIILVVGPVFGLIDNMFITNLGEASICTFPITPTENEYEGSCGGSLGALCGRYNFSLGYHPGRADRNLVIEDSVFWTSNSGNGTMFDTYYYGGKVIFRNNYIWNGTFYSHWTGAGSLNGLWLEFYNNTSNGAGRPGNYVMRLQGGATGLIYNNTIKNWSSPSFIFAEDRSNDTLGHGVPAPLGACNGTKSIDGNAGDPAAPGWPCLAQTGRGNPGIVTNTGSQVPVAPSFPTYLWRNGTQDACAACTDHTGVTCTACTNTVSISSESPNYIRSTPHPNGDVDFCSNTNKPSGCGTHTLIYTPLAYPHPLRGTTGAVPSKPSNFRTTMDWIRDKFDAVAYRIAAVFGREQRVVATAN